MQVVRAGTLIIGIALALAAIGLDAQPSHGTPRGDPPPTPSPTPLPVYTPVPTPTSAPPQGADLHVSQSGADQVKAGKFTSLTLTVTNGGPDTALHVRLTDTLSIGAGFKSHAPGCKVRHVAGSTQRREICKFASIAPNVTRTRVVKVRGQGPELTSDAKATGSPSDPTPADAEFVKTLDLLPVITVEDVVVGPPTANGRHLSMQYTLSEDAEVRMNVVPHPADGTVPFEKQFPATQGTHTKLLTKHAHLPPGSYRLEADARVSPTELSGETSRFFTVPG
jgi:uncharacterized repeat protein (TIGR01451 family)